MAADELKIGLRGDGFIQTPRNATKSGPDYDIPYSDQLEAGCPGANPLVTLIQTRRTTR